MMDKDIHLKTGKYDPEAYWSARARASDNNTFQAVCAFGLSDAANAAMEKVQEHMFSKALREIDLKGAKALEFGCGVGRWAPFVKARGAKYTGTDISEDMLNIARSRSTNVGFAKLKSTELPFPDNTFDFAFSITVLHHNSYDHQVEILREMLRILKPGGHLLLMEGICSDEDAKQAFNMFPRPADHWVRAVTVNGRASLINLRFAHWWPLADAGKAKLRKIGINLSPNISQGNTMAFKVARVLLPVLNKIDIALMGLLPPKHATNATMLFRKSESQ